jgi:hypothetical protein
MASHDSGTSLHAYSIKLSTADGQSMTLPKNLLTADQAKRIADDLQTLAQRSGLGKVEVELSPIGSDDRDRVIREARLFFSSESQPKALPAFQVAVKCISCQTVMALNEALSSSQEASDFLTGDPIPDESRCEDCSRHSIENCYECRAEWLITNSQGFNFVCDRCREQSAAESAAPADSPSDHPR